MSHSFPERQHLLADPVVGPSCAIDTEISAVDADKFADDQTGLIAPTRTLSNNKAMMNLIKGLLGTGILSLPAAFHHSGLWAGFILTIVCVLINVHCMQILVDAAQYLCATRVVKLGIAAGQLGACSAYIVFVASNVQQIALYYSPSSSLHDERVCIAILILPFLLLSSIRRLDFLSYISAAANLLYLLGVLVTFFYIFYDFQYHSNLPAITHSWKSFALAFGMIMFTFEGAYLILPIENKMLQSNWMNRRCGVLWTGCLVVLQIYLAMGYFGYVQFGEDIADTITLNLPQNKPLLQITKAVFALAIAGTYSLQFYVFGEVIESTLSARFVAMERRHVALEWCIRFFTVFLTFVFALVVPRLDLVITLVGSVSATAGSQIFPCVIDLCCRYEKDRGLQRNPRNTFKNAAIILFGVTGMSVSLYSALDSVFA